MTPKSALAAWLIVLCTTTASQAATYDFSFTLHSGTVISGALTGNRAPLNANVVENAVVQSFGVTDAMGMVLDPVSSDITRNGAWFGIGTLAGFIGGIVSFDGSAMDILACKADCNRPSFGLVNGFGYTPFFFSNGGALADDTRDFLADTWSLREQTLAAVPLPASLPLLAAGIGALTLRRRKA